MRIGLVSTSALPTPPDAYGGTELVISELALGLQELGHDVLLYATGDSACPTRLVAHHARAVWPPNEDAEREHADFAFADLSSRDVDIVHVHHAEALRFHERVSVPCVATLHHDRIQATVDHYRQFPDVSYVAISRRQAELVPELSFAGVVHHGLDPSAYTLGRGLGGYAAFVGRFCAEKGVHHAIDASVMAGVPLVLGGVPHPFGDAQTYFLTELLPRIRNLSDHVMWLGELRQKAKQSLLRDACALLFPVAWEEPFGLVMIEAMLAGTPVIAFDRGAVREVVEEGVTGFIVETPEEMAARLRSLGDFDRARCRARAIERWSRIRMAADYVAVYEAVARSRQSGERRVRSGNALDAA
jgi:glycosyltransferase involved in cell wall biosynthesis